MVDKPTLVPSSVDADGEALPEVKLSVLQFTAVDEAACVAHIVQRSQAGEGGWVVTPNVDILRMCTTDRSVRELVGQATLTLADGMPLIWASRLQGTPLPERVCGSNLIFSVSAAAADADLSVFMLGGGKPDTADKAANVLRERYPRIHIAGTYFPPFGFEHDQQQIAQIAKAVQDTQPDIVYVALSVPKTEKLIAAIRHVRPSAWWIGVGISFSFICGEVERAPKWMQKSGLEWVHRLIQEPRRLIGRYLLRDVPFALRLLATSAWRRKRRPVASDEKGG
ncbi:MAG: WecB/TagA/CpsF family glycosyltransferase [Phycisphaeraceae bacterium]